MNTQRTPQEFEQTWSRYVQKLEEWRQLEREKAAARAAALSRSKQS
jgi:hypothetical protein